MAKTRTTLYITKELWKKFREICLREGETCSMKVEAFLLEYVAKHEPGNPQMRIDRIVGPRGPISVRSPQHCRYYGGESKGQIFCGRLGTWYSADRCERCTKR